MAAAGGQREEDPRVKRTGHDEYYEDAGPGHDGSKKETVPCHD